MTDNRPRKSVKVAPLVDKFNKAIVLAAGNRDKQEALCFAIETILFDANAYGGFQHIDRDGGWWHAVKRPGPDVDSPDYYARHFYGGTLSIPAIARQVAAWRDGYREVAF